MPLLEVSNLGFGHAGDALFEGVTFRLSAGERAGLVAPNGAGKSPLLRIIAGELPPERRERLRAASGDDWEKLDELSRAEVALTKRIDTRMLDWERVADELARIDATSSRSEESPG